MIGRRTVDVTDFGADRTGERCSAAAVADALASVDQRHATIRFPRGRYSFRQEGATTRELYISNTVGADPLHREKRIAILIDGGEDIDLDGDGSTFVFHGTQTMLAVLDSHGVRIRDVELDFARPTVIDATVVKVGLDGRHAFREISVPAVTAFSVDGSHVRWVGEDSPSGEPYWEFTDAGEYCQMFEPRTGLTRRLTDPVFRDVLRCSDLGDGRIRIDYRHSIESDDVGAIYQYRRTTRDHPGIALLDSAGVTLRRLRVRFLHGFGVVSQNGRDLRVSDCEFAPPPGSGRATAGFADFLQCSGMSGVVEVTDSNFRGAHDDPINIHGTYLRVVGFEGNDRIRLEYAHPETAGFAQFAAGDLLEIVDADRLRPLATSFAVVDVEQPTGRDSDHDLRRLSVRVHPSIPDVVLQAGGVRMAVENISRAPEVTIERCRFGGVPTRGVLVTTRGRVRIVDSIFDRLPMPSVLISGDATEWWESGPVDDVVLLRNRFIHPGAALVQIAPTAVEVDARRPIHGRVAVLDSAVETTTDVTVVDARSVRHLEVRGTSMPTGTTANVLAEAVAELRLKD